MLENIHQFPDKETLLSLAGPAGHLELLVDVPRVPTVGITAVICHPHPLLGGGGSMHNKVVTTIARTLRELGINTVCFNFRGVGQSAGQFAQGMGESEDLLAVTDWVLEQRPNDRLWLAGFSFGAYVSLRTVAKTPANLVLSIAPPVQYPEFQIINAPSCPWIVVQGELDDVVNPAEVYSWLATRDENLTLIKMANAGHFFHGQLITLKQELITTLTPFINKTSL